MSQDTVTKAELATQLSEKIGLPRTDCQAFIEQFFETISQHLIHGVHVKLSGFGKWLTLNKKERIGRNPRTKKEAVISARRVVSFKAGGKLIRRIEKNLRQDDQ